MLAHHAALVNALLVSLDTQGWFRTYTRLSGPCDPPVAVGVEMSAGLQDNLPGPSAQLWLWWQFAQAAPLAGCTACLPPPPASSTQER